MYRIYSGKYVQKIEMDNILTHAPLHIIYATGLFSCPKKGGVACPINPFIRFESQAVNCNNPLGTNSTADFYMGDFYEFTAKIPKMYRRTS